MISENVSRYENVVVRNHKEIGINDYGLDYLVKIEQELERYKNIIDELEKDLNILIEDNGISPNSKENFKYILNKLKELKGE